MLPDFDCTFCSQLRARATVRPRPADERLRALAALRPEALLANKSRD